MAVKKKTARKKAVRKAPRTAARKVAPRLTPRKQPETLRIRSASPGLTVGDIERSLHFYTRVLGFIVKDRWEQNGKLMGVEVRAGNASVMLGQDDWQKGRDRIKGVGFRIYCSTVQDVDKLAAGIKARGGVLDHEPQNQPWGMRDFGITDPDGFKITIGRQK